MSAYICSPEHFKALALFATRRCGFERWGVDPRYLRKLEHPAAATSRGIENLTRGELATLYADTLYRENVRSVAYRYDDTPRDQLPGPNNDAGYVRVTRRDENNRLLQNLSPVDILKMCDGLEYQSCETPDYRESVAFELLSAIRKCAIHQLPGYEEAPWAFDLPRPARKRA